MTTHKKPSEYLDQELVSQVLQGDSSAFNFLVLKYQQRIIYLANRYVKDPSEAEDVAQETFIKAYRALDTFRGDSAFYTWLYRIAINTAKNYLLSGSRAKANSHIEIQEVEDTECVPQLQAVGTPETSLLNAEIIETISRVIKSLPEEMRTAIMLREFEDMSYEEIAQVMDCPVGTVRSRIFRAREAIDNELKPLLTSGDYQ